MQKRGQLPTLWMLVSIIGAVLIAYVLANIGSGYVSGEAFLKSRVAKELALEINALYSVLGNTYVINNNTYNFSFEFKDNEVRVFYDKIELLLAASYEFVKSGQQEIDYKFEHPKQLAISKIDNKIEITKEIPDFFKGVTKKEPDFKKKKILIYYDINDLQSSHLVESIIILNNNKKTFPNLYQSYEQDKIKEAEVIIGIYSKISDKAMLYINKKLLKNLESLSLANAFSNKINNIIGTEIISLEEVDEDKKDILGNDKIAVYIEFPKTKKIVEVANAVYASLEVYSE